MEPELEALTGEEARLLETRNGLKGTLVQVSSEGGRKLEEIRKLTKKVEELKNGKKNKPRILKEEEDVNAEKVTGTGPMERKEAALILPEEIWKMIFENVPDPKDLWNLTNTCQLFDSILSPWKTGWMLAKALPYIYKDLPGKKLLECREVCKSWNAAVDNFIEEHPSIRPHNSQNINPRRLDFVNPMAEKRLWNRAIVISRNDGNPSIYEYPFIPKMPGRNPFTGRAIILNLRQYQPIWENEDEDAKNFVDKISNFLTSFGNEIWYLDLQLPFGFGEGGGPMTDGNLAIAQFVSVDMFPMLPNLRELRMDCFEEGALGLPPPRFLPPVSKLETFHVYEDNDLHMDSLSGLRMEKYHSQLRKVCVCVASGSFYTLGRLEWPNLTELQLSSIEDLADVGWLPTVRVRMPQLSKLVLNMKQFNNGASFHDLLEEIRRLSSNTRLDTLRLEGAYQSLKLLLLDKYFQAPPSIKTLELEHFWQHSDEVPSYTFLLHHFPLVENLHLFLRTSSEDDKIALLSKEDYLNLAVDKGFQEVFEIVEVNKYAYRGQMYRSNIWELLHHLKVFTFQWDVYTRHEYEEYQEKRKRNSASMAVPLVPE